MSMDSGSGSSSYRSGTFTSDVDTMADEDDLSTTSTTMANGNGTQQSMGDQMKDTAQQALTQTKQATGQAIDKAKDTVLSQISTQKDRAADTLGGFTQALHQTGQQLRQSGQGVFGDYADSLAGQVDRAVSFLRENDVDDLARQAEDFARNQPALFIGGAFVLGVALARFLKSSAQPQQQFATASNMAAMNPANTWENKTMSDTGAQNTSSRSDESHIPDQVYGNADPARHLDQFSDDAIPDNPVPSAHGYVAGVGSKGDDSAEGDAMNVVSESTDNAAAPGSMGSSAGTAS